MADESHLSILAQGVEQGHAVLAEAVAAYTQALPQLLNFLCTPSAGIARRVRALTLIKGHRPGDEGQRRQRI